MSWTDERVEQLKKLWAEGLSASQIAAQLGGVSRNAVIGKVHRLHLPGRAKSGGSRSPRAKRPTVATQRTGFTAPRTSNTTTRPTPTRSGGGGAAAAAIQTDVDAVAMDTGERVPIARSTPQSKINKECILDHGALLDASSILRRALEMAGEGL